MVIVVSVVLFCVKSEGRLSDRRGQCNAAGSYV